MRSPSESKSPSTTLKSVLTHSAAFLLGAGPTAYVAFKQSQDTNERNRSEAAFLNSVAEHQKICVETGNALMQCLTEKKTTIDGEKDELTSEAEGLTDKVTTTNHQLLEANSTADCNEKLIDALNLNKDAVTQVGVHMAHVRECATALAECRGEKSED